MEIRDDLLRTAERLDARALNDEAVACVVRLLRKLANHIETTDAQIRAMKDDLGHVHRKL